MEQVGPGGVLLVLENLEFFDLALQVLRTEPGRIGLVGFGAGAIFPASLRSVDASRVAEIEYFGDLDVVGLRTPINADRAAKQVGLPAVRPAVSLYEALLQRGRPEPGQQPVPPETAATLTNWLAPEHRTAVVDLLCSGYRLSQEAVDTSYLRSHSEWREEA
jgi:hypothetical protein